MNEQVKTCPKCGIAYSAAVYDECANCNPDAPVKKNAKIEMFAAIIAEELTIYGKIIATPDDIRELAYDCAVRIVATETT